MFELVVLMTYLARAWKLLDRMYKECAFPYENRAEMTDLLSDLNALFADPSCLNPVAVTEAEPVVEPVPAVVADTCPACVGEGVVKSKFMPYRAQPCENCGGTGKVPGAVIE